nr:hypothetical protein [Tanacetum cinerariifolium]
MVCCACGLEAVIRTSWTNRNPSRRLYGCPTLSPTYVNFLRWYDPPMCQRSVQIIPGLLISRNELEEILAMVEEKRRKLLKFLITQREARQANELFNLTRQRHLLASVNYRRAIIKELERLPRNLVACKTTEHLKRIQKAIFVEMLDIIDERRSFIGELEQRLPANVMAYMTRQELKCHQKDDMIRELIPKVKSISNKDLFYSNSSLHLFARFSFLDSSDHGVGISNLLSESDKYTSLGEHVIIPGPAGIAQTANLCKLFDKREGGEESVMSTQEYIRKVIEDVAEDDNFTCASWLSAIDYVNVEGGFVTGCFGDVKKFLKNRKLEQIVAVIKSCTLNAMGDLTVTLKDLSGTITDAIHYKVLTEERFAKAFKVGRL